MSDPIKPITEPSLLDATQMAKRDIMKSINCCKIGEIQSFDQEKKTATVQVLSKRVLPDQTVESYPLLLDCPVVTIQGGGAALQMPIEKGDQCLVLFSDRNIDAWYTTGSAAAPLDQRTHDLSDGIVIVGVNSLVSDLDNYEDGKARLIYSGAEIGMNEAGLVTIKNQVTDLLTLLNGLIDVIAVITTQGGPTNQAVSAASAAALQAYKLQLAQLLNT